MSCFPTNRYLLEVLVVVWCTAVAMAAVALCGTASVSDVFGVSAADVICSIGCRTIVSTLAGALCANWI